MNALNINTRFEREPPPVFAGREAEIGQIRLFCEEVRKRGSNRNGIILVEGPPGIGKTAFLVELSRRAEAWGVRAASLNAEILDDHGVVVPRLIDLVERTGFRIPKGLKNLSGGSVAGFGLQWRGPTASSTLHHFSDLSRKPDAVGLVAIDEIQTLPEAASAAIQTLHKGEHGLPFVVVCAGLSNSARVLAERGVSRIDQPIALQHLSKESAHRAVNAGLRARLEGTAVADVPHTRTEPALNELVEQAEGFPRHLAVVQRSVLECMDARGRCDWDMAIEANDRLRRQYYAQRLNSVAHGTWLAKVARAVQNAGKRGIGQQALMPLLDNSTERFDAALRMGLVRATELGLFVEGIPSLAAYINDQNAG